MLSNFLELPCEIPEPLNHMLPIDYLKWNKSNWETEFYFILIGLKLKTATPFNS